MRLLGKHALVTAAAQGIGRAVAIAFAAEGADVMGVDINATGLERLTAERHARLQTCALDVTDPAAVARLGSDPHFGATHASRAFDVLFNCAGIVHSGTVLECTEAELDAAWQLNVLAMARLCKTVLPGMIEAGGGSIINMSSVASSVKAVPNRFAYATTKAAVIGLTKSIATDFVAARVRCNAICPGTIDTPSLAERIAAQARAQSLSAEEIRLLFAARQPMGRLGRPEEIAALAVYLASDESSFTTGAIHIVDGGWVN